MFRKFPYKFHIKGIRGIGVNDFYMCINCEIVSSYKCCIFLSNPKYE